MSNHVLMCLKCRKIGHNAQNCSFDSWTNELAWFFSPARTRFLRGTHWDPSDQLACSRCENLNLIEILNELPPWQTQMDFTDEFEESNPSVKNLGKTGLINFWADCPVCCCLFAITPNPSSLDQDVFLVPDWSISRVSGELGAVMMNSPEKRKYATCLLSVLRPSSINLSTRVLAHRGDALCLKETSLDSDRTLGGRRIDSMDINVNLIFNWVEACLKRHDTACLPVATKALQKIKLIDVETREVVRYPESDCDYIALSYVWGDVEQGVYKLGDTLKTLPNTLEDALVLSKRLGKRYIWIDSLCIDQSDEKDKIEQIDRMWSIYRGAWVTIIALSGSSANSGFPRLSRKQYYPQLACQIRGKTLVSLMPTLSQQIWISPWGRRAWTLQEGLLSPRCLYISDHQIYFDCSSMQCSESLDDSRSWAHSLTPANNPTEEGFMTWMLRQAGAGALRIPLDWPPRRLEHWGEKLNLYSYRDMKYAEDAIRAFAGVLQRLETIYPKGFFWGLPIEDFDWALTWRAQVPPTRREGFPTWSWAGWKGSLFFGQPIDIEKTRQVPTEIEICAVKAGQLEQIFRVSIDSINSINGNSHIVLDDSVFRSNQLELLEPAFHLDNYLTAEKDGMLFITAICLQFTPDFSRPRTGTYAAGQNETFLCKFKDIFCFIRIFSTDLYIPGYWHGDTWYFDPDRQTERSFMLLARDHVQGFILHHLMLLRIDESSGVAERETVLELLVPIDHLDILSELKPQKRRVVLQ
jgi:hypothetical protein